MLPTFFISKERLARLLFKRVPEPTIIIGSGCLPYAPLLLIIGWRTEWSGIIKIKPASGWRAVAEHSGAGPEPSTE